MPESRSTTIASVLPESDAPPVEGRGVEHGRQQHGLREPLVDAGVELDVQAAAALRAERVGERPGEQQPAAGDRDDEVGPVAALGDPGGQLAGRLAEAVPAEHLARSRGGIGHVGVRAARGQRLRRHE
jgi:hypothetical protein